MLGIHPDDQLPYLAVGTANEFAEEHVSGCPRCRKRVDHLARRAGEMAMEMASLPSATILLHLENLLASLSADGTRSAAGPLAAFLKIPIAEAAALLENLDRHEWTPGPARGTFVLPVPKGRAYAGSEAFLVRIDGGCTYPKHRHASKEHLLILSGGLLDDDGRQLWVSESTTFEPGTEHASSAVEDRPCILAARVEPIT